MKFKLSFFTSKLIAGILGFLVIFVVVLSILQGRLLYEEIVGKSLKQENERLRRYNAKVEKLEKELQEYKKFVIRVAQLAGVPYQAQAKNQLTNYAENMPSPDEEMVAFTEEKDKAPPLISDSITIQGDSLRHIPTGKPIEGWITQRFSMNLPGFGGMHPGIDFAAKIGTEVRATADGIVIFSGWDDIYGNLVAVDHGNGYVSYYGHNSKNLVNRGDSVHRGEVIALSGNTGRSSAPHLHYEIRKDDVAIDPENLMNTH